MESGPGRMAEARTKTSGPPSPANPPEGGAPVGDSGQQEGSSVMEPRQASPSGGATGDPAGATVAGAGEIEANRAAKTSSPSSHTSSPDAAWAGAARAAIKPNAMANRKSMSDPY